MQIKAVLKSVLFLLSWMPNQNLKTKSARLIIWIWEERECMYLFLSLGHKRGVKRKQARLGFWIRVTSSIFYIRNRYAEDASLT